MQVVKCGRYTKRCSLRRLWQATASAPTGPAHPALSRAGGSTGPRARILATKRLCDASWREEEPSQHPGNNPEFDVAAERCVWCWAGRQLSVATTDYVPSTSPQTRHLPGPGTVESFRDGGMEFCHQLVKKHLSPLGPSRLLVKQMQANPQAPKAPCPLCPKPASSVQSAA